MKLPPDERLDDDAAPDLLEELATASRSGKLVDLLRGDGMSWGTAEELQWPESVSRLRAILSDHITSTDSPGGECADTRRGAGKVLEFRRKEDRGS